MWIELIICSIILLAFGLFKIHGLIVRLKRLKILTNTGRNSISTLSTRPINITGKALPAGELLLSPISGSPCVFWGYIVEKWNRGWSTEKFNYSCEDFLVDDGTGKVAISSGGFSSDLTDNNVIRFKTFSKDKKSANADKVKEFYKEHFIKDEIEEIMKTGPSDSSWLFTEDIFEEDMHKLHKSDPAKFRELIGEEMAQEALKFKYTETLIREGASITVIGGSVENGFVARTPRITGTSRNPMFIFDTTVEEMKKQLIKDAIFKTLMGVYYLTAFAFISIIILRFIF